MTTNHILHGLEMGCDSCTSLIFALTECPRERLDEFLFLVPFLLVTCFQCVDGGLVLEGFYFFLGENFLPFALHLDSKFLRQLPLLFNFCCESLYFICFNFYFVIGCVGFVIGGGHPTLSFNASVLHSHLLEGWWWVVGGAFERRMMFDSRMKSRISCDLGLFKIMRLVKMSRHWLAWQVLIHFKTCYYRFINKLNITVFVVVNMATFQLGAV